MFDAHQHQPGRNRHIDKGVCLAQSKYITAYFKIGVLSCPSCLSTCTHVQCIILSFTIYTTFNVKNHSISCTCIICIKFYSKTIFLELCGGSGNSSDGGQRKFVLEKVFQVIGSHRQTGESDTRASASRQTHFLWCEFTMTADGRKHQSTTT